MMFLLTYEGRQRQSKNDKRETRWERDIQLFIIDQKEIKQKITANTDVSIGPHSTPF